MHVAAAILCDFAEVREGLLMLLGGGIVNLWRPSLPAPMGIALALVVDIPPGERAIPHEISLEVRDPGSAQIGKGGAGLQLGPNLMFEADESAIVPFVMPLPFQVHRYGWHSLRIAFDSEEERVIRFRVAPPQEQPAGVPVVRGRARRRPN